jgi:FkbM family methyltransferase
MGFEPDPYNFNRLKDNISLNSFKNIEIYNFGLGDTKSVQKLHIETASNRGGNKINNNATENFSLIEIIRLDDFIDEKVSQKIDLIKIDVEGFELRVFSGAQNVLRTHKPILFIEVDDNNLKAQGDSSQKLMQFLTDLGYGRIERADTNEKITPQYNFKNTHFDVLCYPS